MGIYLRAGKEIYSKRKQLRNFNAPPPDPLTIIGDPFQSIKTTEVFITSEPIETATDSVVVGDHSGEGSNVQHAANSQAAGASNKYTVTISSTQADPQDQPHYPYPEKPLPGQNERKYSVTNLPGSSHPPSTNRGNLYRTRRYAVMEANNAAWSYTKVAVLFFIAMMVTWIPSSANRVYSVVHPGKISLALEFASAFVLPLQGFWNALIYATTSLSACRQVWTQLRDRKSRSSGGLKQMVGVFSGDHGNQRQHSRKQYVETDSMTELASRPDTKGSFHE